MGYNEAALLGYAFQKGYYLKITHVPTGRKVIFPAILTSFQETYSSTWNSTSVFGKMDPIYTFANTTRNINFAISIPSSGLEEASSYLDQVKILTKFQYPSYDSNSSSTTIRQSPLVRINLFNFIKKIDGSGLLGKIQTVNIEPEVESGFFDDSTKLFPKVLNLNINFDVLHENEPWTKIALDVGDIAFSTEVEDAENTAPSPEQGSVINANGPEQSLSNTVSAAQVLGTGGN
jgi:hypothetical protein